MECALIAECANFPERCNDCEQRSDIYEHHPFYKKPSVLFDIEDLQIIKSNGERDAKDIFITPAVAIRWTQNGRQYGCYVGFYGATREPTAEEVIEAVNKLLQYFLLTARELAKQSN